ncbi:MAG: PLP-dependent aminotransferase family protein [Vicinamibacteria bacterium]|nr:PLP-dependent aminotransferase family protein [Vicinamibacteria bacterium]
MRKWRARLGDWQAGSGPLYVRLAQTLERLIESGEIEPGERLPAERSLASELSASRTTIVAAYDLLRGQGRIASRHGSGSWVAGSLISPAARDGNLSSIFRRNVVFRGLVEDTDDHIEFLGAYLEAAPALMDCYDALRKRDLAELLAHHGYTPLGLTSLRQALARHLSRSGLPTSAEQVLITNGAQQAISLVAALLVDRGGRVLVENPTYLGAIDIFASVGARVGGLPIGADERQLDALREAAQNATPSLVYLIPSHHNPTGTVMPEHARRALVRYIEDASIPVVEDLALADLSLADDPPPPLASFAPQAPILTIGSLSKLFWGGLRVGWIRAPEQVIGRLGRLKALADLGNPPISQALAAHALARIDDVRAFRRRQIEPRLTALTRALKRHLPRWTWQRPRGGLLLWARMPEGDSSELALIARRHGVSIVPGSANSPDHRFGDYVRLPFVQTPEAIGEGIERLARAWGEYRGRKVERRAELGVIV